MLVSRRSALTFAIGAMTALPSRRHEACCARRTSAFAGRDRSPPHRRPRRGPRPSIACIRFSSCRRSWKRARRSRRDICAATHPPGGSISMPMQSMFFRKGWTKKGRGYGHRATLRPTTRSPMRNGPASRGSSSTSTDCIGFRPRPSIASRRARGRRRHRLLRHPRHDARFLRNLSLHQPVSWMIERRRDYRSFHPDVDATKVFAEKQYFDFRTVSGVKTAFGERQVNWKTGVLVNSTMVNSLAFNPQIRPGRADPRLRCTGSLERAR